MKRKLNLVSCTIALLFLFFNLHLSAQENAASPTNFVYKQVGADTLRAYVFEPTKTMKNRAAILLFHGGGWKFGDASWMFQRAKEFADSGLVAFALDYRLANNGLSPIDAVEDACAAFAWVRKHAEQFGIDKKQVIGYGESSGGHLVASTATLSSVRAQKIPQQSRPNTMLLYCPPLNLTHDPYFNMLIEGKGNSVDYSPSEFINNKLPPTLIIAGEKDSIAYTSNAIAFRDKAIELGTQCSLYVYPGVGHMLTRNLKVQYADFDFDPAYVSDAHKQVDVFLRAHGYYR